MEAFTRKELKEILQSIHDSIVADARGAKLGEPGDERIKLQSQIRQKIFEILD